MDSLKTKGNVIITRYNSHNEQINQFESSNMITDVGLIYFAERIGDISTDEIGYFALGDGTDPTAYDTTEMSGDDVTFTEITTQSISNPSQSEDTPVILTFEGIFPGADDTVENVKEIGLFTDLDVTPEVDPSKLIARTVLDVDNQFVKGVDEYVKITWHISLGS